MTHQRSAEKEIMDLQELPLEQTEHIYWLIARVNRFLGGSEAVLSHLRTFSRRWSKSPIQILDVAAGGGDIAKAILDWSRKKRFKIEMTLLDISQNALEVAQARLREYPEVRFVQGSVFDLPARLGVYDYAICSMFFHHLEDREIPLVLQTLDAVSSRGIIVNDLIRSKAAFYGIRLLSLFTSDPVFKNDAVLSVKKGFRKDEILRLVALSHVNYLKYAEHFAYRFTLAGEKNG